VATATRQRSSTQLCAVFSDEPLLKASDLGWYFRLKLNTVNSGWVGGFGIGVTLSTPAGMATLPDRAARVQHSWLAGYWGRTFSNGSERLSDWKPQDLQSNDEVGFLVTTEGECVVYVNDIERCRFGDPPVPVKAGMFSDSEPPQLFALIDVTRTCNDGPVYSILRGAHPPPAAFMGTRPRLVGSRSLSPPMHPPSNSPTPGMGGVGVAEATPPPPPPSPSRAVSPQHRFGPPASINPPRIGGTSSPPPVVPPLLQLRQGTSTPHPPVPPLLPLRQGLSTASQPGAGQAASNMTKGDNWRSSSPPVARTSAARRIPKLALPLQ